MRAAAQSSGTRAKLAGQDAAANGISSGERPAERDSLIRRVQAAKFDERARP